MKAYLKNYRQSPRKVRLVADFVRGKQVSKVLSEIVFLQKRAAMPIKKLIESAAANAKENSGIAKQDLLVKDIYVDQGFTLKRYMPRAFGRASRINKRTSNIKVILEKRPHMQKPKTGGKNGDTKPEERRVKEATEHKKEKTDSTKLEN